MVWTIAMCSSCSLLDDCDEPWRLRTTTISRAVTCFRMHTLFGADRLADVISFGNIGTIRAAGGPTGGIPAFGTIGTGGNGTAGAGPGAGPDAAGVCWSWCRSRCWTRCGSPGGGGTGTVELFDWCSAHHCVRLRPLLFSMLLHGLGEGCVLAAGVLA